MRSTGRGFSMPELALTLVIVAILTAMALAKVGSTLSRSKVDRAASVMAADLELAFSTGGRLRQPVRLKCDCANKTYQLNDVLNGGTLRFQRTFGPNSAYPLDSMRFTPDSMTVLPPGRVAATTLPFQVDLYSGGKARRVTMSSAGFVRITTP
jgi:prepilin-type N-terminal cleavage/methylation domain-containing protein